MALFGPSTDQIERSAIFSEDRVYRYTLERYWDKAYTHVLFVLLNPSTADEQYDDPTNRRGIGYAQDWGYGGVVFVNLFACRTAEPHVMKRYAEPIGPDNDKHILDQANRADCIVLAWGIHGTHLNRNLEVAHMLLSVNPLLRLFHFGFTQNRQPKHPLYLRRDAELQQFPGLPEPI